jgi:hypothetical protein
MHTCTAGIVGDISEVISKHPFDGNGALEIPQVGLHHQGSAHPAGLITQNNFPRLECVRAVDMLQENATHMEEGFQVGRAACST